MKKILGFIFVALFSISLMAQLPVVSKITVCASKEEGQYVSFNADLSDTLKSADTLFFIFPITHKQQVWPYIVQYWKYTGTNDTTVLVTFWESHNGSQTADSTWFQLYNTTTLPVTLSAYTKTVTLTSSNEVDYSFREDMAWLNSRYFGIRYIARTKTGFKSIPFGTVKFNQ